MTAFNPSIVGGRGRRTTEHCWPLAYLQAQWKALSQRNKAEWRSRMLEGLFWLLSTCTSVWPCTHMCVHPPHTHEKMMTFEKRKHIFPKRISVGIYCLVQLWKSYKLKVGVTLWSGSTIGPSHLKQVPVIFPVNVSLHHELNKEYVYCHHLL